MPPADEGYFKDVKLDVAVDAGNPDAPNIPAAFMTVYNDTPAPEMDLKKIRQQDGAGSEWPKTRSPGV